ncbi:hypothetical protein CDN99_02570 [Roseateles aquatilis]|uniref:Uncharacterized protein n=1 Tax=Roseateles aquatilis TaxID=431061 RepID=A0A246JLK1_9BURK|nr:hypothetical protein CDN99_02570 [Roseateles aquatilis]
MDLSHRLQNAFHGTPAAEVRDDALRQWLDTQRSLSRTESKAVARALNDAFNQRSSRIDLSHLSPKAIDALPDTLVRRMAAHADHLTLPVGCDPNTVMRWIEPLNLSKLVAYGMTGNAPHWRDDQLPERLTLICSDRLPVPESDLIGTHRLYDIRDRHVAAHIDARPGRGDTQAGPTTSNTLSDYIDAALIAKHLVQWASNRLPGEHSTSMQAESAQSLKRTLSQVDLHLLAPKAREACRLVLQWLQQGQRPQVSATRASQLALACTAMARAFTADTINGPALATPNQLARLQQRLLWIDEAPDLHARTDRELLLSRELDLRAPDLLSPQARPTIGTSTPMRGKSTSSSTASSDSGFASARGPQGEVDYVNTRRPPPVYTDVGYADMSGAAPSLRKSRGAAGPDRPTRLRGQLPSNDVVDAAEAAMRPLRRALAVKADGAAPSLTLDTFQRTRLSDALKRTDEVLPARLAATRARATHWLKAGGAEAIELSRAQVQDLLDVFDALRGLSAQTRSDDERPALPTRPPKHGG